MKRIKLHAIEHGDKAMLSIIKEAERAQDLRKVKNEFKKWWQDEARYNNKLIEQNKLYRESIEFAIEESRWGNEGTALDRVVKILCRILEELQ